MTTLYIRILDSFELTDGLVMDLSSAVDLANYDKLDIVVRVSQAGEGESPTFLVEHSASNEEGSYLPFSSAVAVDLTTTGTTWFRLDAFTRWIGWRLSGSLSVGAVVTLEILARP